MRDRGSGAWASVRLDDVVGNAGQAYWVSPGGSNTLRGRLLPAARLNGTRPDDSARASLLRSLAIPLLVWGVAAAVVAIGAWAFGYDPWDSATWSRFDSGLYEDIARDGYDLFRCDPAEFGPGTWCGDAGWFPAYSWLVGGLHAVGLPLRGSAVVLSWLLTGATIFLIWATFLERSVRATALTALVYAAFAPGQVYDYAVFPLSLLAFSTVLSLWLLYRERWVSAGIAGAVAALSYPLGVVLVPVSATWILLERAVPGRERARRTVLASGLMLTGPALLLVVQRLETGRWNAYFLVQDKYHHMLQLPFVATWDAIAPIVDRSPFTLAQAPVLQTALATATLVLVLAHAALRHRSLDRLDALLLLWALATWAFPWSQSNVSHQRGEAALLPLAILVARLPWPVSLALAAAATAVALPMEKLFLDGVLF